VRIAESEQNLKITGNNDFLILDINPNNLLTNNMIVNGVIEIVDSNDNMWIIDVELTAKSSAAKSLNDYVSPGQMIGLACMFAALWIFLTMKENQTEKVDETINKEYFEIANTEEISYDAWGRPIDD